MSVNVCGSMAEKVRISRSDPFISVAAAGSGGSVVAICERVQIVVGRDGAEIGGRRTPLEDPEVEMWRGVGLVSSTDHHSTLFLFWMVSFSSFFGQVFLCSVATAGVIGDWTRERIKRISGGPSRERRKERAEEDTERIIY